MKAGEALLDFVGPLGNPTELEGARRACVIGGGLGCAIAYPRRSGFTIMVAKSMSSPVSARLTWLYSKTNLLLARIVRSS